MLVYDKRDNLVLNLHNVNCIRVLETKEGFGAINFNFSYYSGNNIYFPDLLCAHACLADMMLCFNSGGEIYIINESFRLFDKEKKR